MMSLFEAILYSLVLFHESQGISNNAYNVLSTKIQGVSMEVDFLRNTLVSTNEKVYSLENKLEQASGGILNSTTAKHCDNITTHHINNETEMYFKIFGNAWQSEKQRARDIEERLEQKLENTKEELGVIDKSHKRESDELKEAANKTKAKLEGFSQRLDAVEKYVGDLKVDQTDLVARLQAEKGRTDQLESNFEEQKQLINSLREELSSVKSELANVKANYNEKFNSITTQLAEQETCQSGNGVGVHTYPSRSFPYRTTVKFNPPFKRIPTFVYGTVLLDATTHTRYNANLKELTKDHFTIEMSTWATYYLWGARISWMACPT